MRKWETFLRKSLWAICIVVACCAAAALPEQVLAGNMGTLPVLGIGGSAGEGNYQFDNGIRYVLNDDGISVSEGDENNWNLVWDKDDNTGAGTLRLKDVAIKDTLYVPGNTTIEVTGNCSIDTTTLCIQVQTEGSLTLAMKGNLSLSSTIETVDQDEGDLRIGGEGSLSLKNTSSCSLSVQKGSLVIEGSVSVLSEVEPSAGAMSADNITFAGTSKVSVCGKVSADEVVAVKDSANVTVKATGSAVAGNSGISVDKNAVLTATSKNSNAINSFMGPIDIAGTVTASSDTTKGTGAVSQGVQEKQYGKDITVTGQLNVLKGTFGVVCDYGNLVVKGGTVNVQNASVSGLMKAFDGSIVVDGGEIIVSDSSGGITVGYGEGVIVGISIQNNSDVRLSTTSFGFLDKQAGGTKLKFGISDSNVVVSSKTAFSGIDPTLAYTTDAVAKVGTSESDAQKARWDAIDFSTGYINVSVAESHAWSQEWTTDAKYHWHTCENSYCTIEKSEDKEGFGAHSGGKATFEYGAFCSACGVEYTDSAVPADYTAVKAALDKAAALNRGDYVDFSQVDAAVKAVVEGKDITEQADVDAMAQAIEDAVAALEKKPAPKPEPEPEPQPVVHTVTFVWGGKAADVVVKVEDGKQITAPTDAPELEGYSFTDAWYLTRAEDGTLSDEYNFSNPVTSDLTLYAGWIADQIPVDPEGGESADSEDKMPDGSNDKVSEVKPTSPKLSAVPETSDASLAAQAFVLLTTGAVALAVARHIGRRTS